MIVSRAPVIFLAYANDRVDPGRYLRDLVQEVRQIRQHLQAAVSHPYEIVVRGNATLEDIIEVFSQYEGRIQVFHFAGHSDSLHLLFEGKEGGSVAVGQEGFTRYLSTRNGLRFVFLNGCTTYGHAEALAQKGVLAILATSTAIADQAAASFSISFYEALCSRKNLHQAFREAEAQTMFRLDKGTGVRGLYLDGDESRTAFPWALLGEGIKWRLRVYRAGARGPLIPLMCNRDPQVEVFQDKLEQLLSDQTHPPHVVMLHGLRNTRLNSLARRFIEADIRLYSENLFGRDKGVVYAYQVKDWPYTGDLELRKRNLKRALARSVDIPGIQGASWEASELMSRHHDRAGTVVFRHQVSAEKWDGLQSDLLQWYIGKFWNLPHMDFPTQYLILIQVVYPDKDRSRWKRFWAFPGIRQKVSQQLHGLENQFPAQMTLLRELQPIKRVDVQEWVDEYYPDQLMHLPDKMFGNQLSRRLTMQEVERQLSEALAGLQEL